MEEKKRRGILEHTEFSLKIFEGGFFVQNIFGRQVLDSLLLNFLYSNRSTYRGDRQVIFRVQVTIPQVQKV